MSKRIYRFGDYLRKRFAFRVRKLPVDAGFTCPNRDGTKGTGGCTYCDNRSFSPPARDRSVSVREQIEGGLAKLREDERAIVYFQPYTNTYAPVDELGRLYETALSFPRVVGLAVGTRPDCVPDPVLELLASLCRRAGIWIELGLESGHDATLAAINRGHGVGDFEDAVVRARGRGLETVCHLIFGLPGETREMMLATADRVAALAVEGVKLHHLYVAKGTPLEAEWRRGGVKLFSFEEWIALAADVIERMPPETYVERVTGELSNEWLLAPRWGKSNVRVWDAIEAELGRRGSSQGSVWRNNHGAVPPVQQGIAG